MQPPTAPQSKAVVYVETVKRWIALYGSSPEQLRDWWTLTKDARSLAGVEPGTPEYDALVSFCAEQIERMKQEPAR